METTVTSGSSQTTYPWKAAMRTLVAYAVPALILLATVLGIIKDTYADSLPADVTLWIAGATAFLLTTATAITRIMAVPGVDKILSFIGLGSTPKDVQTVHAPKSADVIVETPKLPYQSILKFQEPTVTAEKTMDALPTSKGRHVLEVKETD